MKFQISKVSDWRGQYGPPHPQADYNKIEQRWEIEIQTLEELMAFDLDKDGLIIDTFLGMPRIRIFDDYL